MPEQVNSLQTSFWVMVVLQTLGSVDMPGRGPRKMPSPRNYLAIIILWGVLQVIADTGRERGVVIFAWVVVLAGMVLGPFGSQLAKLFNSAATSVSQPTG